MADPRCPKCGRQFVQRSHRAGILERLLSILYVYPFRCQVCMHRFRSVRWGRRYRRRSYDRREFERIPVNIPARLSGLAQPARGIVTDISVNGCNFTTDAFLETGAEGQLDLDLESGTRPLTVEAAVVHSTHPGGAGIVFSRVAPEERNRLSTYMTTLMIRRLSARARGSTTAP